MPWQFQRHDEIYTLVLIRAGMGVGLINTYMSQPLIERGELLVVLADFMPPSERGIYLCYQSREHMHMPLKQRVVIDFLVGALASAG